VDLSACIQAILEKSFAFLCFMLCEIIDCFFSSVIFVNDACPTYPLFYFPVLQYISPAIPVAVPPCPETILPIRCISALHARELYMGAPFSAVDAVASLRLPALGCAIRYLHIARRLCVSASSTIGAPFDAPLPSPFDTANCACCDIFPYGFSNPCLLLSVASS